MGVSSLVPKFLRSDGKNQPFMFMATGAIIAIVVGFSWGGWTLGSTVAKMTSDAESRGRIAALVPLCQRTVMSNGEAMKQYGAANSYDRSTVVRKFARADDGSEISYDLANACVGAIDAALKAKAADAAPKKT